MEHAMMAVPTMQQVAREQQQQPGSYLSPCSLACTARQRSLLLRCYSQSFRLNYRTDDKVGRNFGSLAASALHKKPWM